MRIVVCVKQVPDSWAEKTLGPDGTVDRAAADRVLNDLDEYAVEEAIRLQEAHGAETVEIVVLSMGPTEATEALRKALQMGADRAVLVSDPALHGTDAIGTSTVLAAALRRLEPDLVLCGIESTDAKMSVVPAMLAEHLDMPQATIAQQVSIDPAGRTVSIQRQTASGYDVVEAALPAVVSVVEKINEPRYPSFKGIMAAKKKPLEEWTLSDLGVDVASVGLSHSWSQVAGVALRPPRTKGTVITDEGDGGQRIAQYLLEQKLV